MRHLALKCPRCQTEVTVWLQDLGQTIRCKRCRSPFHVNSGGKCVRGERPLSPVFNPYAIESEPARNDLIDRWSSLPKSVRLLILGVFLIGAGLGGSKLLQPKGQDVPESLLDRTRYAAEALMRNDLVALSRIADPATAISTQRWIELKRPASWAVWEQADQARVQTSVLFQNAANGAACTVATLSFPPFPDDGSETPGQAAPRGKAASRGPQVELVMFWKLADNGLWLFDGGRTVKESSRR